nr:protein WEAK CHLOROPLAST MOVEMENT UNDER BLUE LIGHT-like 2 [Aegilops tauschii subsp. strangulata]
MDKAEADLKVRIAETQTWFRQACEELKAAQGDLAKRDVELTTKRADIEKAQETAENLAATAEASLLAASAQAAEASELKRKLKLADDEIDRINKRFDEAQGSATEVETLKSALVEAKEEAKVSKVAADKAAADLKADQVTHSKCEERVTEVEQALQDAANKCEALEESNKAQATELTKALQEAKEARSESRAAREEIKQARQIAAGEAFGMSRYSRGGSKESGSGAEKGF